MNVEDFDLNVKYEATPKTGDPFVLIPIKAKPSEDSIIVLIIAGDGDHDFFGLSKRETQKKIKNLQNLTWENLGVFIKYPGDPMDYGTGVDKGYKTSLEKWDSIKGRYITPHDMVITSINSLGLWESPETPSGEEEELRVFHEAISELSELKQALCQSIIGMDGGKRTGLEWVHEITHASISIREDLVVVTLYSGISYSISKETLANWGWKDVKELNLVIEKSEFLGYLKEAYTCGADYYKDDLLSIKERAKELIEEIDTVVDDTLSNRYTLRTISDIIGSDLSNNFPEIKEEL